MFTELLFFGLTLVGLIILDKVNVFIGIVVSSVLIYICVSRCRDDASGRRESSNDYFDFYVEKISKFLQQLFSLPNWYNCFRNIRKIVYLVKTAQSSEDESQFNSQTNNSEIAPANAQHNCGTNPSIDEEIKTVVDCILREYIKSWYHGKISENKEFVSDVECIIQDTLIAFCNCIAKSDKEQLLSHILQVYLHFLFHFKESIDKVGKEKFLDNCVNHKKKLHDNFEMHHWALKGQFTEWSYLESIMGALIDSFGPAELLSCSVLRTVIIEILTQNVMYPLINVITDPDRLNIGLAKLLLNFFKVNSDIFLKNNNENEDILNEIQNIPEDHTISTTSVTTPTIVLSECLQEMEGENDSDVFSPNHIFDFEANSNVSGQTSDISIDGISTISNDSLQKDAYIDSPCREKTNKASAISLFLPLFRARSNTSISNKSADLNEYIQPKSPFLQINQMKRSHSADFIRQMIDTSNFLPLNLSNHNIRYCEKTKKNFLMIETENTSSDVEVAEEAIEREFPPLFSEVKIINTQQQMDSGHNPYTLYCIQYKGVFENLSSNSHYPDLVQQLVCIKRRFREFLALQSRLEDDPSIKILLKEIKGPSKWLATPFGNLDKKNIAERQVFLESYLQELCKHNAIVSSSVLQEFMAYGGDASIAFVKKTADINVPRIDKLIVKSVKGAIDLFRTALPNTYDTGLSREPSQPLPETPEEDMTSETKFQIFLSDFTRKVPEMAVLVDSSLKQFDAHLLNNKTGDDFVFMDSKKSTHKHASLLQHSHSISTPEECNCINTSPLSGISKENLLALSLIDVIAESFHNISVPHVLKFVPVSLLQSILEKKIDELGEEQSAFVLHTFHKTLWPEAKPAQHQWHSNMTSILHSVITQHMEGFLSQNQFLKVFDTIVGTDSRSSAIELLLGSIQNEKLNKCLLYYVFDAVINTMCSREC